jgi:hypothetical protein
MQNVPLINKRKYKISTYSVHFRQSFRIWSLCNKAVYILSMCIYSSNIFDTLYSRSPVRSRRPKILHLQNFDHCNKGSQRTWTKNVYTVTLFLHSTTAHPCEERESVQFRQLSRSEPQRSFAVASLRSDVKDMTRDCWSSDVCFVDSSRDRIKTATFLRNGST